MASKNHYWEDVYALVRLVPRGRVTTYGAIADYLRLGAPRMVGWALNHCHSEVSGVPAHRVINRLGELSGRHHFATPTLMQELLAAEGLVVLDDKVQDFERLLWLPLAEIIEDVDFE